jgi:hypothetical protein
MSNYDPGAGYGMAMQRTRDAENEVELLRRQCGKLMRENAQLRLILAGIQGFTESYQEKFCKGIDTNEEYPNE